MKVKINIHEILIFDLYFLWYFMMDVSKVEALILVKFMSITPELTPVRLI